jgi:hypothetical protein
MLACGTGRASASAAAGPASRRALQWHRWRLQAHGDAHLQRQELRLGVRHINCQGYKYTRLPLCTLALVAFTVAIKAQQ